MPNEEISKRLAETRGGHDRQLWLSGLGLTSVPSEVWELTHLEVLGLDGNQLEVLPKELGNLTKLRRLYLDGNRLVELPEEIGNLPVLTELDLSANRLTSLPKEIGKLANLKGLNLTDNRLTTLPEEIGNLSRLYYLRLTDNRLTTLPEEIGRLTNLRGLHLTRNRLTSLPDEMGSLVELVDLCVQHNLLTRLPQGLGRLSSLRELCIAHNPLGMAIPHITDDLPVCGDELARLCRYLRSRTTLSMSPTGALEIEEMGEAVPGLQGSEGTIGEEERPFDTVVAVEVLAGATAEDPGEARDAKDPSPTVLHDSIVHAVGDGLFYSATILDLNAGSSFSYVFDCGAQSRGLNLSRHVGACLKKTNDRIDLLVLSHLHWAHVSGIKELIERATGGVDRVVLPYLSPAERLHVASVCLADAVYRDERDGCWYREFLAHPAVFLKGLGVRQITLIRGGDEESIPSQEVVPAQTIAQALAHAQALTHAQALAHAETLTHAQALAHAQALTHAQAPTHAQALAHAETLAHAQALMHAETLMHAEPVDPSNPPVHVQSRGFGKAFWSGSPLAPHLCTHIQDEERRYASGEEVDADQLFDSRSTAGHDRWEFSFFHRKSDEHRLAEFSAEVLEICDSRRMDEVLSDDVGLKLVRHAYRRSFSDSQSFQSSLAMCCHRLPQDEDLRNTLFQSGLSPRNDGKRACLRSNHGSFCPAFVLTGDLPVQAIWKDFARKFRIAHVKYGRVIPLVYQIPHHGSRESFGEEQRDTMRDGVFVVSGRRDNRHGYPHADVLRALLEENRPLFWANEDCSYRHRLQIRTHASRP